jgi:hypothetical protein
VKKGVDVQMLIIFACVYSDSIVAVAISMNERFLAFLFFANTTHQLVFLMHNP